MGLWLRIHAIKVVPVVSGSVEYAALAFTVTPGVKRIRLGSPTNNQLMPTPETTPVNRVTRPPIMEIPKKETGTIWGSGTNDKTT